MSENKPDKLYQLSDVDQNSEFYKLFEEEINFFNHFFSFEKYSKTINNIKNLPEFINDPIFIDFQQHFETFIRNENFKSFLTLYQLLSFLYTIRPKYLPIIILITPIIFDYYSPYINDIKNYLSVQSFKTLNNFNYHPLSTLFLKIINENQYLVENLINGSTQKRNIKLIQMELLQHSEYLTLCSFMSEFPTKNQFFIKYYLRIENEEPIGKNNEEMINIIIQDDYNELIAFLSKHPEFSIHSDIVIPYSHELIQLIQNDLISLIDLCCFFGSNHCFKYFYMNLCKFSSKTNKYCIIGGNYEIIQILNQLNIDFNNCLDISITYHQYSLSDWLLANYENEPILECYCASCYNMKYLLFINYNTFQDYNITDILLQNINEKDINLIHKFCEIGYFPILEYFIKNGCNKDCQNHVGRTPLHIACKEGHLKIVEYLISIGCNKDCQDEKGKTPLHFACREGYLPIVECLIRNGCNKECQNKDGLTPLHFACRGDYLPIVQCLIRNGCNKECKDIYKSTPLHDACKSGHLKIVEYLISIECNKDFQDKNGLTPLHFACRKGYFPIVEYLISIGCNKECQDKDGLTPLHFACREGSLPIVEFLIKNGCNKECKDKYKSTPLDYALMTGHQNIANYLESA